MAGERGSNTPIRFPQISAGKGATALSVATPLFAGEWQNFEGACHERFTKRSIRPPRNT